MCKENSFNLIFFFKDNRLNTIWRRLYFDYVNAFEYTNNGQFGVCSRNPQSKYRNCIVTEKIDIHRINSKLNIYLILFYSQS